VTFKMQTNNYFFSSFLGLFLPVKIRTLYDELDSKEAICWTRNPYPPQLINFDRSNFTLCTFEIWSNKLEQ
jgi:hypothetical protein